MNTQSVKLAISDPQGWNAAIEVMKKAGYRRASDAAYALESRLGRLGAVLRAVQSMLGEVEPDLIDVGALIDVATETMDGIGSDPLAFVHDHDRDVTHAVYGLIAERDAAIQRSSLPPVPPDQFANVLGEAIELALNKVGTPANQNKPVSKRKATAKGAA